MYRDATIPVTMKVSFLGTAGYHPNERAQTACVALPDQGLVLDAGTGFFRMRDKVKKGEMHILLSHFHLDHTAGLTYLYDVLWGKYDDVKVIVYGMEGIEAVREHLFSHALFPLHVDEHPFDFELRTIEDKFSINDIKISTKRFVHKGGVVAYRLERNGKAIVYITDTEAKLDDSAIKFASKADLLIHECYFLAHQRELAERSQHSYTTMVAEFAKRAKVKKLALFHFNPLNDRREMFENEAKAVFNGSFATYDGLDVKV